MAGVFKFLSPKARPQPIDIQAAALWGVAAVTSALWIVQVPFFILLKNLYILPFIILMIRAENCCGEAKEFWCYCYFYFYFYLLCEPI